MRTKKELHESLELYCTSPVRTVVNGTTYFFPCGKCPSCLNSKSNSIVQRIRAFASHFKHIRFVTLTYASEYLPVLDYCVSPHNLVENEIFSFIDSKTGKRFEQYSFIPRVRNLDHVSRVRKSFRNVGSNRQFDFLDAFESYADEDDLRNMSAKQGCEFGTLYYAPYRDLNLFLKRLRRVYKQRFYFSLSRVRNSSSQGSEKIPVSDNFNETEKISYFAVSEYGEKRYRPHWHLLLFSNSDFFAENIEHLCNFAWGYGICSTELPRGECAGYVANYIGNTHISLPVTSYIRELSPKRYASNGLRDCTLRGKYYLSDFEDVSKICLQGFDVSVNGGFVRRFPAWQDICRLFPRFKSGYQQSNHSVFQLFESVFQIGRYRSLLYKNVLYDDNVEHVLDFCLEYFYGLLKKISNFLYSRDKDDRMSISSRILYEYHVIDNNDLALIDYLGINAKLRILASVYRDNTFAVIDTPLYKTTFSRFYKLYRQVYVACLSWNIKNYDDYCKLRLNCIKYWQEFERLSLKNHYISCETVSEAPYIDFIYNYFSYDNEGKNKEILSNPLEFNPLYSSVKAKAFNRLMAAKHHKKNRHLLSGL